MYIYNGRTIAGLLLLVTLAVIAAFPMGAFGAVSPDGGGTGGQAFTITREFTYKAGETPNIPETISQYGVVFTLVSVSEPVASTRLPRTRTYTYRVPAVYTPDQLSQVPPGVSLTPVYGEGKRQVDRSEVIRGLKNNDVDSLPQRKTYSDTTGQGPGARVSGSLTLAEVKYEVVSYDEDGLPNNYTARVVYRGEETYSILLYYTAVETYTEEVAEDGEETFTVVATYEGSMPSDDDISSPAADEPAEEPGDSGPEPETGADDNNSDEYAFAVPGGGETGPGAGSDGGSGVGAEEVAPTPDPAAGGIADFFTGLFGRLTSLNLPFSLDTLSPVGVASLATLVAVALALLALGYHTRRRVRMGH
ncbi:MAG: hypothetical protein FWH32_02325 [Clostridiales bacterium]|nr:hypothetical protein [Clostridiales bacterium]